MADLSYERYTNEQPLELGDDIAVWRYMHIDLDEKWLPHLVYIVVEITSSGPQCVDLRVIARPNGLPITASSLRKVPLGRILAQAEWHTIVFHGDSQTGWAASAGPRSAQDRRAYQRARAAADRQRRVWRLTDAHLTQVAKVYRDAAASNEPPTATVATHFGVERTTAGRWVRTARERHFLGAAPGPRMKGEQT